MIIDFHNHFFPKPYLDELAKGEAKASVEYDAEGRTIMVTEGDYNIIVPEHFDPVARIAALDKAGVDMQCLTITVPGVHSEAPKMGVKLAQIVNDSFSEISQTHPDRFVALAVLPLQDGKASVAELERAVTQGNLRGGLLFTHINGTPLDDEMFWPLYEKASELDVPLFIHPIVPNHIGMMRDYRIVAIEGFLFETSVATSRLIFSGVMERYPDLSLALAHMGGTLPFLAERMDHGFAVYPECRTKLSTPPSHALKKMYMDTFPHAQKAIEYTINFVGADKLLMGTDYPHQIGDLPGGISTINDLNIPDTAKNQILGDNAKRLLKI